MCVCVALLFDGRGRLETSKYIMAWRAAEKKKEPLWYLMEKFLDHSSTAISPINWDLLYVLAVAAAAAAEALRAVIMTDSRPPNMHQTEKIWESAKS